MKKALLKKSTFDDHVGCFGDFSINDIICRKFCALNLRCSIERDQNVRLEVIEDMVEADGVSIKLQ